MLDAAEALLRERGLRRRHPAGGGAQRYADRLRLSLLPRRQDAARRRSAANPRRKGTCVVQSILEDKAEPLPERVRTLFRTAASGFDRAGANKSCAIGAVALDLDARHEALRTVCRDAMDGWIASIARELPWSDEAVRRSFAEMVVAGLEGAFILSRARQSGTPFITVGEWLATILERLPRNAPETYHGKHKRRHGRYPSGADRISNPYARSGHLNLFRVRQS